MNQFAKTWNSFFSQTRQPLFSDIGLLFLRLLVGLMMVFGHGWGKVSQLFAGNPIQFADPIGIGEMPSFVLAASAEFVFALCVVVGLFTRLAVVPLIITMAVAAFIVHADDPFMKMEFALLYFTSFVALFFLGPGRFSVDRRFLNLK